jgi:hypothetical protein
MDPYGKFDWKVIVVIAVVLLGLYLAWPTIADRVPWGSDQFGGKATIVVTLHYEDGTEEVLKANSLREITILVGDKPISDIGAQLLMLGQASPPTSGNYTVQYTCEVTLGTTSLQKSGPLNKTLPLGSEQSVVSTGTDARDLEANMKVGETKDLIFRFYGKATWIDPEGITHEANYDVNKTITVKRVATYSFTLNCSVTTSTL